MPNIDISQMNKATVLAALYNRAKPQGMGLLHYTPQDMSIEEAQNLLDSGQTYFDYVKGRVMKIDLESDSLRTDLYDHDNGHGAAALVLSQL